MNIGESTKITLTIGQLRRLVKEARLNWPGPKPVKRRWDGMNGEITFQLGKISDSDYYANPARRSLVDITISTERGHFSASGGIWNARGTDINRGGQCLDTIGDHDGHVYPQLPEASQKLVDEIVGYWKKYHLTNLDRIPENDLERINELIEHPEF